MSEDAPEQEAEEPVPESRPRRKKKRRAAAKEAPAERETTEETSEASGDEEPAEAAEPAKKTPYRDAPPPEPEEPEPEIPAFARKYPRDPELDALVAAFEAGDYGRVRREAPKLAKRTDRDDIRAAARELRRRLDPDPAAVFLLAIAAALLLVLFGYYGLHQH
jgi:hypothetical protein